MTMEPSTTPSATPSRPATLAPGLTTPLVIQMPSTITVRIPTQPGMDDVLPFEFNGRTQNSQGDTDAQGKVELPAEPGILSVWAYGEELPPVTWQITPEKIAPDESLKGVQLRCNNLGFDCGVVDGLMGKNTRRGIGAFQAQYTLPITGQSDSTTLSRLTMEYGC